MSLIQLWKLLAWELYRRTWFDNSVLPRCLYLTQSAQTVLFNHRFSTARYTIRHRRMEIAKRRKKHVMVIVLLHIHYTLFTCYKYSWPRFSKFVSVDKKKRREFATWLMDSFLKRPLAHLLFQRRFHNVTTGSTTVYSLEMGNFANVISIINRRRTMQLNINTPSWSRKTTPTLRVIDIDTRSVYLLERSCVFSVAIKPGSRRI